MHYPTPPIITSLIKLKTGCFLLLIHCHPICYVIVFLINLYVFITKLILKVCKSSEDAELFLEKFNEGHPDIKFTIKHKEIGSINFLDVTVSRNEDNWLRRPIHRKSLWSKQYIHFKSSPPISYKISLIKTLLFRTNKICSEEVLPHEINNIKDDLCNNGYPISLINKYCKEKGNAERVPTVPKQPVFTQLQYKNEIIHNIITQRLKMPSRRHFCC